MNIQLPKASEDVVRHGLIHEVLEHAEDVRAEAERLLGDPSELGMRDLRDRVNSLARVAALMPALEWPA